MNPIPFMMALGVYLLIIAVSWWLWEKVEDKFREEEEWDDWI